MKYDSVIEEIKSLDTEERIKVLRREGRLPEKIDDIQAFKIAREIKNKIETELTYPGQIKVTVIREVRANELAK